MTRICVPALLALLVTFGAAEAAPSRTERVCVRIQAAVAQLGLQGAIDEAIKRGYSMGQVNRWRRICGV